MRHEFLCFSRAEGRKLRRVVWLFAPFVLSGVVYDVITLTSRFLCIYEQTRYPICSTPYKFPTKGERLMIRSMYKATAGLAAALMLVGMTSSVYGFTGSYSALTRVSREVQLTGRVVCTNCTLDEARKTQSKYSNHLYRLTLEQQPVIMEIYQTTNATWLNHLMMPQFRVQGEENLLSPLTSQDNVRKDITIIGSLMDTQTLDIRKISVH